VAETRYDVFGDARTTISEVGNVTNDIYDKLGQLVERRHPTRPAASVGNPGSALQLIDYYAYDSLGQRIKHGNSQFGPYVYEATDYDAQGRIVSTTNFAGEATTFSFTWEASTATSGLGTFGAWAKVTTNAVASRSSTERQDYFSRTVDQIDYGGHNFDFTF